MATLIFGKNAERTPDLIDLDRANIIDFGGMSQHSLRALVRAVNAATLNLADLKKVAPDYYNLVPIASGLNHALHGLESILDLSGPAWRQVQNVSDGIDEARAGLLGLIEKHSEEYNSDPRIDSDIADLAHELDVANWNIGIVNLTVNG